MQKDNAHARDRAEREEKLSQLFAKINAAVETFAEFKQGAAAAIKSLDGGSELYLDTMRLVPQIAPALRDVLTEAGAVLHHPISTHGVAPKEQSAAWEAGYEVCVNRFNGARDNLIVALSDDHGTARP